MSTCGNDALASAEERMRAVQELRKRPEALTSGREKTPSVSSGRPCVEEPP